MVESLAIVAYPLRAAILRRSLYVELRGRPHMLPFAFLTVLAASAAGFMSEGIPRFMAETNQWAILVPSAAFGIALNLAAWAFWTGIAFVIGHVLGGKGTFFDLLAATGFAYAPGILQVMAFLAHSNDPLAFTMIMAVKAAAPAWIALATAMAVSQTLGVGLAIAMLAVSGWIVTAGMVFVGSMQQALLFGALPGLR